MSERQFFVLVAPAVKRVRLSKRLVDLESEERFLDDVQRSLDYDLAHNLLYSIPEKKAEAVAVHFGIPWGRCTTTDELAEKWGMTRNGARLRYVSGMHALKRAAGKMGLLR